MPLAAAVLRAAVQDLPPSALVSYLDGPDFALWCRLANCNPDVVRAGIVRTLARSGVVVLQLHSGDTP